jgi:hypothetical protein
VADLLAAAFPAALGT